MSNVKRVYVEKKSGFDVQAKELKTEIRSYLGIKDVDRSPGAAAKGNKKEGKNFRFF